MEKQENKVVLSLHIADELIKRGFPVIEVKPSRKKRGNAVFIFENTPEFESNFSDILYKKQLASENNLI